MRSRTHYLGVVYAPDEKSAEAAAIAEFKIGDEQQRRLIVREQDVFSTRPKPPPPRPPRPPPPPPPP
jgi:hypothetical protein